MPVDEQVVFFNNATQEYTIHGWVVSAAQLAKLPRFETEEMLKGTFSPEMVWELFSRHGVGIRNAYQPDRPNDRAAIRHLVSMGRAVMA